jgi:hypothetical protein
MVRWGFLAEDEHESIRLPIGSPLPGLRGKSLSFAMWQQPGSGVTNVAIVADVGRSGSTAFPVIPAKVGIQFIDTELPLSLGSDISALSHRHRLDRSLDSRLRENDGD